MRPEDRQTYLSLFLTNFNAAVTENALKWHSMEPRRGAARDRRNGRTAAARILVWRRLGQTGIWRGHAPGGSTDLSQPVPHQLQRRGDRKRAEVAQHGT